MILTYFYCWWAVDVSFQSPLVGPYTHAIQSNDFFLSWSTFVVLAGVTSVSEVVVIFLELILYANTAAFFCSLLGLISHSFWEAVGKLARDGIASKRSLWFTYVILAFQETMSCKLAFHAYRAILDSFFYTYSAIVDSFVVVFFFNITFRSIIAE